LRESAAVEALTAKKPLDYG